ncbi:leucine-rich repeat-containing protein 74B-like [Mercenaria mercenaria]|uniref:leucine-rich repeat-containing protein 74B-like n=1 Tax=Mercenaria mercenaria TaxID=6596 RepID=UPI00234FAD2A|nr:leucine-rich repeat-containing protein 74B-like [Mercenaria mercenaria]
MSEADSFNISDSGDPLELGRGSSCSVRSMSRRSTPVLASTPNRRTPSLKGSAKFMRSSSSSSRVAEAEKLAIKNLLQSRLLITQTGYEDDDDIDMFGYQNGRMSRDTDYETDLEMDYDEWIAEDTNELKEDASEEKKYIHMCNQTGEIPISYFLRHLKDTKFRMRYHGLGPMGAKAISMPLKDNHCIEVLDLEGNWIQKEGTMYLTEMIKENMNLTEVNIAENRLGRDGADAICEMLYKNESLKSLNMSGNELHDYGASAICDMLKKNTTLRHLYLSNNKFEERAAQSFKEALSHNETLLTLDISWNHFRTNGAVALAEGVQENYGLKSFNVSMNGFSEMGAEALGRALKHNRGLTELDVSHNRIAEHGAGHIALGLQTNDVLKVLKIGFNPVGEDGAMALIMSISKNDQSGMTRLDLSDIFVSKDFKAVQNKLESERAFTVIHAGVIMDKDEKKQGGEKEILETFRRNPYEKLKKYVKASGYRLIDLFKDFDKDGSDTITKEEFIRGLELAGVEITKSEIIQIIDQLDINGDGMIDYYELVIGDKEYRKSLVEAEQCPDDRKVQRDHNRIQRERSLFMDDIING